MRKNIIPICVSPRARTVILLVLLLLLLGITNYWVLSQDKIPPLHDANICYSNSCEYYGYFTQGFQAAHFKRLFTHISFYPPLYMLIPVPFYFLNGPSHDAMAMLNIFYLILLIISIRKLGNFVFGRPTGTAAAIVVLTFPAIIGFSRITHMNIALTAVVTFNVYLLIKSDSFCSRKYSILAGVIAGLGCWLSSKHMIYIIIPALICFLQGVFSRERDCQAPRRVRIINSMLFLCAAIFILAPYYVPAVMYRIQPEPAVMYRAVSLQFLGAAANFNLYQLFLHAFQYIKLIIPLILTPNFILFGLSVIVLAPVLFKRKNGLICLGWFLSPVFIFPVFTGFIKAQPRFLLPVLPLIAILIAGLLLRIAKFLKLYCHKISTILMIGLICLILASDRVFFLKQHPYPGNAAELLGSRAQYGLLHAVAEETPVSELFTFLNAELADRNYSGIIVIIFEDDNDTAPLALELIYDKLRSSGLDIRIFTPMGLSIESKLRQYGYSQNEDFVKGVFMSSDYILYVKNGTRQHTMGRMEEGLFKNNAILKRLFLRAADNIKLIWQSQPTAESFFSETLLLFRHHRKGGFL